MTITDEIRLMWNAYISMAWDLTREQKIDWLVNNFQEDRKEMETILYSAQSLHDGEILINDILVEHLLWKSCYDMDIFERKGGEKKYYEFLAFLETL
jgi:hypothetical protein